MSWILGVQKMKLEEIGFYTLEDNRAKNISISSPLWRCELILTDVCNFKCPYCREMRSECQGSISLEQAKKVVDLWTDDRLKNIRFSGGEPTLWKGLLELVKYTKTKKSIKRIALSTNGSADFSYYNLLYLAGVNDFSISLDACCVSTGDKMAGVSGQWKKVVRNIERLSKLTYVTVGVVLTLENIQEGVDTIMLARMLGVSDIRIISSAQFNGELKNFKTTKITDKYPILRYRLNNLIKHKSMRGLDIFDTDKCHLVKDDMCIAGDYHFPCIIYFREGGKPIGKVSDSMRKERLDWFASHNSFTDSICNRNCLDVCVFYNNKANEYIDSTRFHPFYMA